jgi:hypothetical protein
LRSCYQNPKTAEKKPKQMKTQEKTKTEILEEEKKKQERIKLQRAIYLEQKYGRL